MLLRISLIIAIIAALAVGILNFVMVKEKIETVERHRDEEQKAKASAQTELATTHKKLDETTADLKQTKETLVSTTEERDKAQAEVAALTKKAGDLTEKLAKSSQERDEARSELAAFKATGQTPEQILNFANKLKQLQDTLDGATGENKLLAKELEKTQAKLAKYEGNWHPPVLPVGLKG
jgi:chromosome segregation ATPase